MVWHRCQPGALSSPKLRRLTAGVNTSSVSMGCVGHTSVHSDSGSCAWGSGVCARCVEQQQQFLNVNVRTWRPVTFMLMTALLSALVGSIARGGRALPLRAGSLRVTAAPYMIDTFPYTGSVRPGKQSPMRKIPSTILRPDYADDGRPKAKGSLLPWQVEVKTAEDIAGMRIAGRVAREVLDAAGRMVAPGMTTDAIDELVTRETIARGAYPSPLNYHNFPKSCCTSINEVICHGIPDSTVLKDGDIVNIDITCYIGGYHGDCSETFLVGNVDEAGQQLVKVTHDCWQAAIEYCKPGQPFSGIGKIIEDFVKPCVVRT